MISLSNPHTIIDTPISKQIRVRIQDSSKRQVKKSLQKTSPTNPGARLVGRSIHQAKAYKDYLPRKSYFPLSSPRAKYTPIVRNGGYRGKQYQKIMVAAHEIFGLFDIPLFIRQEYKAGKAYLKIKKSGKHLSIIMLDGDPYLRALIYESLFDRSTQQVIHELMGKMNAESIRIKLKHQRVMKTHDKRRYIDDVRIGQGTVSLLKTLNVLAHYGPKDSGAKVKDEHSERAKKRDRLRLRILRSSPAYQSFVKDQIIPSAIAK